MGLTLCRWPSKATCAPAFGWAPKKGPAPSSSLAVAWQSSSEVAGTGKAPSRWAGRASPVRHPVEDAEVALSQLPEELFLRAALYWGDTRVQGNTIKTKISLFPWLPSLHMCCAISLSNYPSICFQVHFLTAGPLIFCIWSEWNHRIKWFLVNVTF